MYFCFRHRGSIQAASMLDDTLLQYVESATFLGMSLDGMCVQEFLKVRMICLFWPRLPTINFLLVSGAAVPHQNCKVYSGFRKETGRIMAKTRPRVGSRYIWGTYTADTGSLPLLSRDILYCQYQSLVGTTVLIARSVLSHVLRVPASQCDQQLCFNEYSTGPTREVLHRGKSAFVWVNNGYHGRVGPIRLSQLITLYLHQSIDKAIMALPQE